MARSSYVYVAIDGFVPAIACTVKYEFVAKVRALSEPAQQYYRYFRMPDNGTNRQRTELTLEEVLA